MSYLVDDVAKVFLAKESMTHKKLQKLCYYAQTWSMYFNSEPLISTEFQAWIHGPVSQQLYDIYRDFGYNMIPKLAPESIPTLCDASMNIINEVYKAYCHLTGDELEELTHSESPWLNARGSTPPYLASREVITTDSMLEFCRFAMSQNQADV